MFSFRAECEEDADIFLNECRRVGISVTDVVTEIRLPFPDLYAEFRSSPDITMDKVWQIAKAADDDYGDLHVVIETLRPVSLVHNSFERAGADDTGLSSAAVRAAITRLSEKLNHQRRQQTGLDDGLSL